MCKIMSSQVWCFVDGVEYNHFYQHKYDLETQTVGSLGNTFSFHYATAFILFYKF